MQLSSIRLAAVVAVAGALAAPDSWAAKPSAAELNAPSAGRSLIKPAWIPLGIGKQEITVVLQLAGDPVAVQQGNSGRRFERNEKDQIKANLRGSQDALHGHIQGLGGKVIANYQAAYNGVKVRIGRDKTEALAALPGVLAVRPVFAMKRNNEVGVPLINAPAVWQNLHLRGEGVKVAIIDTGIDYTHANFGGPGTVAAYLAASAAETAPANPAHFGPSAMRVKGGFDFAGDSYNADDTDPAFQPIPHPDSNPLDCNGHGSHVAGTAAGSGVTANGATYQGAYNAATIAGNKWAIGPGVAPKADLYALRVFGCEGSTELTVDAIEWAVDNDMDVINMSLGSSFGSKDDPSAVAATNAAKAGVIVVTSTGNSGANQYLAGSPGSADGSIAAAAIDPTQSFAGALLTLSAGAPISAINANAATFADGTSYSIVVLRTATGAVSLGCNPAEYVGVAGKLVVTQRGTCARVARAVFAQKAGAIAAVMIDNTTNLPPFEGPITGNPDTGEQFNVTIPFFGVRGLAATPGTDGARLAAAHGGTLSASNALVPNPAFLGFAGFSSGGPRSGDSSLKPDITAPGVATVSTGVGTGNGPATISGTSMASPHVAGVAALTRQANPHWSVADIKAAIVNTADPAKVTAHRISRGGTGLVQPALATVSQVIARDEDNRLSPALSFGFEELASDFVGTKTIKIKNLGRTPATFNVSQVRPTAATPHSVSLNRTQISVPPHEDAEVRVTLTVPVASVAPSNLGGLSFREVAGMIQFTPVSAADNSGIALRVPYHMVPRALSGVSTRLGRLRGPTPSAVATVTNRQGAIVGDADFYAWGLSARKVPGRVSNDVRAVGVQSFDAGSGEQLMFFAVNTHDRWSNAATNEFDLPVDVDGDGIDDYVIVAADDGLVRTGSFSGRLGTFVFSTRSGGASSAGLAVAATDNSTALLPVFSSELCRASEPCLSAANPRFSYGAVGFDLINGGVKSVPGRAKFNPWSSAISHGGFAVVAPGETNTDNMISVNRAEWKRSPAKGVMVVSMDNKSGEKEAQLIEVEFDSDRD